MCYDHHPIVSIINLQFCLDLCQHRLLLTAKREPFEVNLLVPLRTCHMSMHSFGTNSSWILCQMRIRLFVKPPYFSYSLKLHILELSAFKITLWGLLRKRNDIPCLGTAETFQQKCIFFRKILSERTIS